jgi:hypothetical protein
MPHVHLGWRGAFVTDQYPGAYPNGSLIIKTTSEPGDAHPVGTLGTVLGSMGHPKVGIGYFVEWQDMPRVAVFVQQGKIRLAAHVTEPGRA